jgi:hypothetical protein
VERDLLPAKQIMPEQVQAWPKTPSRDAGWARNRRIMGRRFSRFLIILLCILAGSLSTVGAKAEENPAATGAGLSLMNLSLNLALVSHQATLGALRPVRLALDSRFNADLKDLAAERERSASLSTSLLRKPLVWIREGPRARIRPGFGEFFRGETVEPLRCSGAGVDDSRYLYVKLSFRF